MPSLPVPCPRNKDQEIRTHHFIISLRLFGQLGHINALLSISHDFLQIQMQKQFE